MSNRRAQSGYFRNQGQMLTRSTSNQSKPMLSNKPLTSVYGVRQ